jgi:urea carboxylase-associated protein 2
MDPQTTSPPRAPGTVRLAEEIPGGAAWSHVLKRATALRLTALADGANASVLLFNEELRPERMNLPDTLKSQERACVAPPMVLVGDMGNALCTVTGSSLAWHDALCGHSRDEPVRERWGESSSAADRNAWRRSAREGFLRELAKRELGRRDLHQCVNFFSRVQPAGDARGSFEFVGGHASAGDWVELRADVDVLVVLSTAPHPLDTSAQWAPSGLAAEIRDVDPDADDDAAREFRDQSARALDQTRRLHA